jgi:Protein of unknown function (DUF998)
VAESASLRVRQLAIIAIVAQSVFPLTWLIAGGVSDGYSHEEQYVSELAARDAEHAWIAAIGIAALGLSWIALGLALRAALPRRRWSWLPSALFVTTGAATTLVVLLPVDCSSSVDDACRTLERGWDLSWRHYAHGFVAWANQLLLAATPFALALALRPGLLSRLAFALGVVGLLIGAGQLVAQFADEDRAGIYQRAGLVAVQGWTYLLAAAMLLAATVRPTGFAERASKHAAESDGPRTRATPDPSRGG